ncbi:hypothetical protein Cob_v002659 [Colletotrichum orbiculare MAFF 240422]|uniref:Uncharacterized protein n=1 Tax=Colletotrichum orbiculare (strain 104-T / ATCC 96160 / CBS 514.97 / LARS 414 / MAFF 240422) TaxID=1213857 RepID=A0A484G0J5_COLOR|nr:hypothetical protein Cob_v002659 [Colletotrichum orbiculare MAFF 240422]
MGLARFGAATVEIPKTIAAGMHHTAFEVVDKSYDKSFDPPPTHKSKHCAEDFYYWRKKISPAPRISNCCGRNPCQYHVYLYFAMPPYFLNNSEGIIMERAYPNMTESATMQF